MKIPEQSTENMLHNLLVWVQVWMSTSNNSSKLEIFYLVCKSKEMNSRSADSFNNLWNFPIIF